MRFLLTLLLLANLVLFLYARREDIPAPPPSAVAAEKIILVKPLADGEPAPPVASRPINASDDTALPAAVACLEWGPLPDAQLDNARAALNRLPNIDTYQEVRRPGPPRSWLVSLEGFTTRNAANTRAAELRRQNINDISIVESDQGFMLSLGVFSAEQGAQSRAATLTERKVSGVKITPRTTMAAFFAIPNPDASLAQSLQELSARFADTHIQPCAPAAATP